MAKILVVEDEPGVREILSEMLREHGHEVMEAPSGDAAAPLLQPKAFDLLCTDIVMPGALDGIALARLAAQRDPELGVICVTGYSEAHLGLPPGDPLCRHLLKKPFKARHLLSLIDSVLCQVRDHVIAECA
jgi:CheY-like chemotaxis protein